MPHRTASNISAETTLLLAKHPNIVAVKEASGDLDQCAVIANSKPSNFLLISGDDALTFPILKSGGEGVISVLANAFPEAFCKMAQMTLAKNFDKGRELNDRLLPLYELLAKEGNPTSIKAALYSLGICSTNVRLPLISASLELTNDFRKFNF